MFADLWKMRETKSNKCTTELFRSAVKSVPSSPGLLSLVFSNSPMFD